MLETTQGRTIHNGGRNGIPCCRRAVTEGVPTKISRHYMVHREVAGLKNGEPVVAGVLEEDHRDKMADRLLRSYR